MAMNTPRSTTPARGETASNRAVEKLTPVHRACLQALELRLKRFDCGTDLTENGLIVRSPYRCALTDTITCRPREDDDERLWFFTAEGKPIAEADHLEDAALQIRAYLTRM